MKMSETEKEEDERGKKEKSERRNDNRIENGKENKGKVYECVDGFQIILRSCITLTGPVLGVLGFLSFSVKNIVNLVTFLLGFYVMFELLFNFF